MRASNVARIKKLIVISSFITAYLYLFHLKRSPTTSTEVRDEITEPKWESQLWNLPYDSLAVFGGLRQVTIDEVTSRFQHRTGESCPLILKPPRCPPEIKGLDQGCWRDVVDIEELIYRANVSKSSVPLYNDDEYIFEFEGELLKDPPLTDLKLLPDLDMSNIVALSVSEDLDLEDSMPCKLGQTMTFRADLVDGYGNPRSRGNDEVRAWTVQGKVEESFSATAQVQDLQNGSYLITTRCMWPGRTRLKVGVVYPREYRRAVAHQSKLRPLRPIAVRYQRGERQSVTLCTGTPNLPYPCLCNFTEFNSLSYYCGMPMGNNLVCDDAKEIHHGLVYEPFELTDAELNLTQSISITADGTLLTKEVFLKCNTKDILQPPNVDCRRIESYKDTWDMPSPQGFWSKHYNWHSLLCETKPITDTWPTKCLRDSKIWLFGDSNMRHLWEVFNKIVDCEMTTGYVWPMNMRCVNKRENIKTTLFRHEYPYYPAKDRWDKWFTYGGVAHLLDTIPEEGKHFVIVHYFLHMSSDHSSAIYTRFLAMKDAILRLLDRVPKVKVAIVGPHAAYEFRRINPAALGDVTASLYKHSFYKIFKPLKDRVIYLNGWEMSVAIENKLAHPEVELHLEMARYFLSLAC